MTSAAPALVVMAAGIGSRFGGTKQLAEVGPGGEALLDYTIADARRAGFGRVVLIVRQAIHDDMARHLARFHSDAGSFVLVCQDLDRSAQDAGVPERERRWGTGHAVLAARDHVAVPFAVVNADDYYGPDALADLGHALSAGPGGQGTRAGDSAVATYHLVAYQLANTLSSQGTVSRGVCRVSEDGRLEGVTEHLALRRRPDGGIGAEGEGRSFADDTPVSMNLWGLQPSLFGQLAERFASFARRNGHDAKAEFQLPTVITDLVSEGLVEVRVRRTKASWLGVTYPGDLDEARQKMAVTGPLDRRSPSA